MIAGDPQDLNRLMPAEGVEMFDAGTLGVYVVTSGRGRFTGGDETIDVAAGSVFFVPAREEHRFHDIVEDLAVLVFFGPAEGTR